MIKSGWVITYKSERKIIMTESGYEWFKDNGRDAVINDIQSEAHWFSLDDAIRSNPGAEWLKLTFCRGRKFYEKG